jgi:hypothetical protein
MGWLTVPEWDSVNQPLPTLAVDKKPLQPGASGKLME